MDETVIQRALEHWGVTFRTVRKDVQAAGSPERCMVRVVVEGAHGALFLLERIAPATATRKREMARLMGALAEAGLPVAAPLVSAQGETLVSAGDRLFQLTPFVTGGPLERPGYTKERWRGEALAHFLLAMRGASKKKDFLPAGAPFDLPGYIDGLTETVKARRPKVAAALAEATAFLKRRLYPHWANLPTALAHGDVHGLNILWRDTGIAAVIDWEFCGPKPLLYDVANMTGCCGMETPDALLDGLAPALIHALKKTDFADAADWALLPECVMALRYAWLSEWLRKGDAEMINLELSYIYLLMDNRDKLAGAWGI